MRPEQIKIESSCCANVLVIGAFGFKTNQLDGQTVKTRNVYQLINERWKGKSSYIDTIGLKKSIIGIFRLLYSLYSSDRIVVIPAERGLSVLIPFLYYLSFIFRYSIICICVGGWQIEYFKGTYTGKAHMKAMRICKRISAFLPEMVSVNELLIKDYGFKNTEVFPNFRRFNKEVFSKGHNDKLRLVFMARIQKKKGYPMIFQCVDAIREKDMKIAIDFYGQLNEEDSPDFLKGIEDNSDILRYKGELNPDIIQNTLCDYDVLLLPTQYYTEGFPGSVLDAFIAGIPVIVTEWKHSHEFVEDGKSGFIIPFSDNSDSLMDKICLLYKNRKLLYEMKQNAKRERSKYSNETAWCVLSKYLDCGKE